MGVISVQLDLRPQTAARVPPVPLPNHARRGPLGVDARRMVAGGPEDGRIGRARAVVPQRLASDGVTTQVLRWIFGHGPLEGCASGDCAFSSSAPNIAF